ncbi:hypothetical protein [Algoriphagus sp.]|uniref:hypothetical protein n=1 Tax=Algoriphagus sp. TaxID=1872435 RepID=UPI003F72A911
MKKYLFCILCAFIANLSLSQTIVGNWHGILKVSGTEIPLVFHIMQDSTSLSSLMDSPNQNAFGIKVTTTHYSNSIIKLEIKEAGIKYEGQIMSDSTTIDGKFHQGGGSFSLILKKQEDEENDTKF